MEVIIGIVKELSGKFYAKDADGKVTELHTGDKVLKGMVVYGADGNSAKAHVNIDVKSNGEILEVHGNQQQLFDLSLIQDHGNNGESLSQKNIDQALDKTGVYAEDGATNDKEKAGSINDDETAAGSEAVVGHLQADQFAQRDNAFVDVHSSLRDVHFNSPHGSTLTDLNKESIIVDASAPIAPTADISDATNSGSDADTITNDNTPTITGKAEAGSTVTVTDANGTVVGTTTAGSDGTYSVTTSQLPDGSNDLTVTATDTAGNISAPTSQNVTVDTTGPVVSVDSLVTSDTTPELTGKVDDPHAVVNVTIEGESYEAKNNGDGTWTLPNDTIKEGILDNVGIHDIEVKATDRAGNIGTDTTTNELNIFKETHLGGPADGTAISFKITGDHYDPNNQQDVGAGSPKYQIFINGQAYKTSDGQSTFTVEANRGEVSKDGTHMLRDVPEFEIVTLNVPIGTPIEDISIKFINDAWDGRNDNDKDGVFSEDRNLVVDKLNIAGTINSDGTFSGGTTLEAEDKTTTQYLATNGHDVSGREVMPWAGEMTFYPHGVVIATPKVTLDPSSDTGISNNDGITADNTPTVNITLGKGTASGDTIDIKSDGKVVATHTVTDSEYRSGHANVSLDTLNDGQHVITTVVSNGVLTSDTASFDITIDTATPDYAKLAITDIIDNNGDYSSVTMVGRGAQSGDTIMLYDEQNTAVAKTTVNKDGSWSIDISNLKDTPINDNEFFKVTESDIAGNTTAQTDTVHYWHGEWTDSATESTDDYVMSGAGNDTIHTDAILSGTNENGFVTSSNNDTNDKLVIDGGKGTDTVTFAKEIAAYNIAVQTNGHVTVTENAASDSNGDGKGDVTELRNVEILTFADGSYDVVKDKKVLFQESFENLHNDKSWHIETGLVTGDHGMVWDTHSNGLEVQNSGTVVPASDGSVSVELDASANVTMSTNLNLNGSDQYTLSFDYQPRDGGNSRNHYDTSDMQVTFGDKTVAIDSDSEGNLTLNHSDGVSLINVEDADTNGWHHVSIEYSGISSDSATLAITGTGASDSYGALIDNIKVTGESTTGIVNIDNHVLSLSGNSSIDFSNLENLSLDASKVTTIDLTKGEHSLCNLSLNDVLDMTDSNSNHTLTIMGDKGDSVSFDTTGWRDTTPVNTHSADSSTEYSYSNGSDSITLKIDDQINT